MHRSQVLSNTKTYSIHTKSQTSHLHSLLELPMIALSKDLNSSISCPIWRHYTVWAPNVITELLL